MLGRSRKRSWRAEDLRAGCLHRHFGQAGHQLAKPDKAKANIAEPTMATMTATASSISRPRAAVFPAACRFAAWTLRSSRFVTDHERAAASTSLRAAEPGHQRPSVPSMKPVRNGSRLAAVDGWVAAGEDRCAIVDALNEDKACCRDGEVAPGEDQLTIVDGKATPGQDEAGVRTRRDWLRFGTSKVVPHLRASDQTPV